MGGDVSSQKVSPLTCRATLANPCPRLMDSFEWTASRSAPGRRSRAGQPRSTCTPREKETSEAFMGACDGSHKKLQQRDRCC